MTEPKKNEPPGALGPWTASPNDPDGDGALVWSAMPPAARAAACLVALGAKLPLDTDRMRFDPGTKIASVWRPSPGDPERKQLAQIFVDGDEIVFMERIRAAHGPRWAEVEKLIRPPRRWFPTRRKR